MDYAKMKAQQWEKRMPWYGPSDIKEAEAKFLIFYQRGDSWYLRKTFIAEDYNNRLEAVVQELRRCLALPSVGWNASRVRVTCELAMVGVGVLDECDVTPFFVAAAASDEAATKVFGSLAEIVTETGTQVRLPIVVIPEHKPGCLGRLFARGFSKRCGFIMPERDQWFWTTPAPRTIRHAITAFEQLFPARARLRQMERWLENGPRVAVLMDTFPKELDGVRLEVVELADAFLGIKFENDQKVVELYYTIGSRDVLPARPFASLTLAPEESEVDIFEVDSTPHSDGPLGLLGGLLDVLAWVNGNSQDHWNPSAGLIDLWHVNPDTKERVNLWCHSLPPEWKLDKEAAQLPVQEASVEADEEPEVGNQQPLVQVRICYPGAGVGVTVDKCDDEAAAKARFDAAVAHFSGGLMKASDGGLPTKGAETALLATKAGWVRIRRFEDEAAMAADQLIAWSSCDEETSAAVREAVDMDDEEALPFLTKRLGPARAAMAADALDVHRYQQENEEAFDGMVEGLVEAKGMALR